MRSVLKGLAIAAGNTAWWAGLLLIAGMLIGRGGVLSGFGIALNVLDALVALVVSLIGFLVADVDGPDLATAWAGIGLADIVVLLGFGAALEHGSEHSGRLVPYVVSGAGVAVALYVTAYVQRSRRGAAAKKSERTVGELRRVLTDLPDEAMVRFEVLGDAAPWLSSQETPERAT
jgi:hypothetical protein